LYFSLFEFYIFKKFSCTHRDFSLVMEIWFKVLEIHWSTCVRTLLRGPPDKHFNCVMKVSFSGCQSECLGYSLTRSFRAFMWGRSGCLVPVSVLGSRSVLDVRFSMRSHRSWGLVFLFSCTPRCLLESTLVTGTGGVRLLLSPFWSCWCWVSGGCCLTDGTKLSINIKSSRLVVVFADASYNTGGVIGKLSAMAGTRIRPEDCSSRQ